MEILKWSQKAFKNIHKRPSKEVTKSLLKKSQKNSKEVTKGGYCDICRLFTIKVLQKASQNTRHKIVVTG
jgi:hypothetical protein